MEVVSGSADMTSREPVQCPPRPLAAVSPIAEEDVGVAKFEKERPCNKPQPKKKSKPRGKLVRSVAVCEETSTSEATMACLEANSPSGERTLCQEEEEESNERPKEQSPPTEPAEEYTDSTGIDLHQFILDTLNSNPRDRLMLLKLEQDMTDFIASNSSFKKFPHMSPFHRMLVHRVAAYFGMEHNVDQTGKSVIINTTSRTRIPEQRFLDMVHKDKAEEIQQWKEILKRSSTLDKQNHPHLLREKQGKSTEEREDECQRARDGVSNKELLRTQESARAETREPEEYNPYAESQRRRQLFRGSRHSSGSSWTGSSSMQSSVEADCHYSNDPRPWSSTDSDSSYQWTNPAPKPRQPPGISWDTHAAGSIALYRLPPTCSQPSPPPPIMEEPVPSAAYITENGIPPGSILVNPRTGQPFLNPDGTPAVYNPPDNQQPIKGQTQLQGCPSQPLQQQVVQYSSVSYMAPQMVPVTPSQTYPTIEDLSSQFAHVTVGCQSAGDPALLYHPSFTYAAPAHPNPPGYCQPSPQVPGYYYGQYPTSAQYGCSSPSQHAAAAAAVAAAAGGYAPAVKMQQSHSNLPQTVLGTYTPAAPHQCSMVQGGVSMPFSQSKAVTGGASEVGYCCVVPPPPPPHHTSSSSSSNGGGGSGSSCHPASCTNLSAPAWSAQY